MEQKQSSYGGSVCEQLPHLSAKCPWFVAQNLGAENNSSSDQIFYTLHDPLAKYHCQIPELMGRRIRGYYHGWIILSDHPKSVMWSLWNPLTSKIINIPPLTVKDGDSESIKECCLSAPPDDPSSVLLLTRADKPSFVFFRLKGKRKKLRWTEMSYASQLKRITGDEDGVFLNSLACCNGKVYALSGSSIVYFVIQLDILVKDSEVLIKLLLLGLTPSRCCDCPELHYFLKGHCTKLFCIIVGLYEQTLEGVYVFKLDMASVKSEKLERFKGLDMSCKRWQDEAYLMDLIMSQEMWEELVDIKEAIFFVDIALDYLVYYRPAIASELGGYIHIRVGKILYSYHVKDNTISLSSMPSLVLPTSNVSLWECRLENDHGVAKCPVESRQEEDQIVVSSVAHNEVGLNEFNLLDLPFDILKLIMKHCVGVEYMNFRATCKCCHVAAPLIQWSNEASLKRLMTYSLVSPWLLVVDKNQRIASFTDPMSSDNYFKKNLHVSLARQKICCSMFGWLLLFTCFVCPVFINPFTNDLRKLPVADFNFKSMCFSAPPTSPNCMVVGFPTTNERLVLIHYVGEPSWRTLHVDAVPKSVRLPTFLGQDLYALGGEGELIGFKDLGKEDNSSTFVGAKAPISCIPPTQVYLTKCDQDLLKVIVGKFGEHVAVFKWIDTKQEWEKIDSLGKHTIYVCGTTSFSIKAKIPEMENKIYFPLLHSKNKKMVFYSLATCKFHTFIDGNIEHPLKDILGTTYHLFPHVWIEPSWS